MIRKPLPDSMTHIKKYNARVLKKLMLLRERVTDWEAYPFSVAAIRALNEISFQSRVAFFAGENGSGKSTLLERLPLTMDLGARVEIVISATTPQKAITPSTRW